jgi:hypothetical protein
MGAICAEKCGANKRCGKYVEIFVATNSMSRTDFETDPAMLERAMEERLR